jgi:hypothetical protein
MVLTDANGQVFRAHFRHVRLHDRKIIAKMSGRFDSSGDRWWMQTECTLHRGPCPTNKRPCDAKEASTGVAKCSRLDNFDRRKGLKLAFERALNSMYPSGSIGTTTEINSAIRGELWASFWSMVRKPKARR